MYIYIYIYEMLPLEARIWFANVARNSIDLPNANANVISVAIFPANIKFDE